MSIGDGNFKTQKFFAVGALPSALALVDLTGDGALDVVAVNKGSNSVSVLVGNGNGDFESAYRADFDWNLDGIDLSRLYLNFGTIWQM